MERMMEKRYVEVWSMKLYPPEDIDLTAFNREIRNWLGQNIGSGSWETELSGTLAIPLYVKVIFDIEAEEDAMAFKIVWS